MTGEPTQRSGGCLCGAVRYRAEGDPVRVIHCHCRDCRKQTGAAMATLPVYPAGQVVFSGAERRIYASSDGVGRAFCGNCGASLTYEANLPDYGQLCALHISSFDDPESLRPTHHSFDSERISWFEVADDLPRHARLVSEGGLLRHGPATRTNTE